MPENVCQYMFPVPSLLRTLPATPPFVGRYIVVFDSSAGLAFRVNLLLLEDMMTLLLVSDVIEYAYILFTIYGKNVPFNVNLYI